MKHLFLDLEETIITSWWNPVLVNIEKIGELIRRFSPEKIHIFSGAIWDEDDRRRFVTHLQTPIEEELKIKIDSVITMEEATKNSSLKTFVFSGVCEMLSMVGKFKLFEDYCETTMGGHDCVLLDDQCPSKTVHNKDTDARIEMFNIYRSE